MESLANNMPELVKLAEKFIVKNKDYKINRHNALMLIYTSNATLLFALASYFIGNDKLSFYSFLILSLIFSISSIIYSLKNKTKS